MSESLDAAALKAAFEKALQNIVPLLGGALGGEAFLMGRERNLMGCFLWDAQRQLSPVSLETPILQEVYRVQTFLTGKPTEI